MDLPPAWSQGCICGRTFTAPQGYTNHLHICKKMKTWLSSALDKARQIWQANKHHKTEVAQLEATGSCKMEDVPLPDSHQQVGFSTMDLSFQHHLCFFFPYLSEWQDPHGLRRSPPTFSGMLNMLRTSPTSEALSRYTTCTSSRTFPLSSDHAIVYTNRVRCTPVSIPAMPSACLTAQKDPQIHVQHIWAFPTILHNSLSRSRSCPI